MERECKKHGLIEYKNQSKTGQHWKCPKCLLEKSRRQRTRFKAKCVEYKGGQCQECGYSKCMSAMEFHHIDPSEKRFGIGDMLHREFSNNIKLELDKCILLCSNCHKELHSKIIT